MATTAEIEETTVEAFSDQIHGDILQPGDDAFDEVRTIWNAMIDKEPAVIARCTGAADVVRAVDLHGT